MTEGQEVTKAGFMAANKMTASRSEITLCIVFIRGPLPTDLMGQLEWV